MFYEMNARVVGAKLLFFNQRECDLMRERERERERESEVKQRVGVIVVKWQLWRRYTAIA
jgi:hypothetical protein